MTIIATQIFGGAADAGPWVEIGSDEDNPEIVNFGSGDFLFLRLWGRLSDSVSLGLYNGYINVTDDLSTTFPWTQTLNSGLVHYDPRIEYDEDDWSTRWDVVNNTGVSMSISLGVFGVFNVTASTTVGIVSNGANSVTIVTDWSTDGTVGGIVHTTWARFVFS